MSEKTSTQTLKEVLAKTDEQILSNWASLGSLIKNFENVSWQDASKMARELLRDENAMDYIEQVRSDLASKEVEKDSSKAAPTKTKKGQPSKKAKEKKSPKAKIVPMNTKRDRFSMNFKRLVKIAPELVERLESGAEVYGKSKSTGYMDFNLELIHKNARGYYLALSQNYIQNGDVVPDPDMQVLFNTKNQTLEALAFQNQFYYREVFDNIYDPKLVNERERQSQNSFLEQWLINLDNQGHSIKWIVENESPNPIETQIKKPHVDDFPNSLVTRLREEAETKTLGELRKALAAHLSGGLGFKPLEHFITAERINEITKTSEAKYPTQESLKKQSLEESDMLSKLRSLEEMNSIELIKPDISFIDPQAIADAKKYVSSIRTLDEVVQAHLKHSSGEQIVYAHVLYFMAERINENLAELKVPYPTTDELRRDYQKVLDVRLKQAKVDEAVKNQSKPSIYEVNYRKLLSIAPELEQQLRTHQTNLQLRSEGDQFLYDLVLKVPDFNKKREAAAIMLVEAGMINNELVEHTAMEFYIDLVGKKMQALLTYLPDGEILKVYEDINNLEGLNEKEQKEQNIFLGKWLDELIEQGHKLLSMVDYIGKSEVIDEYHTEDEPNIQVDQPVIQPKTEETKVVTDIEKTAKHWKKLAAYISEKEGLDKEAAKVKALDLKSKGEAEDYLIGKIERTAKVSDNQLLKLNYQKLNRLVPIIDAAEESADRRLVNANFSPVILIKRVEKNGKYGYLFKLSDVDGLLQDWIIKVQTNTSKVHVTEYKNPNQTKELEFVNLDEKFGEYLDAKLKQGLKLAPLISELLEQYPIVIEWTEGTGGKFIGIQDLQELRSKLKKFGFTDSPNETYIKNKIWFKGYPHYVRIDVSQKKGDYNPYKMELDDWLDDYDSNFDWYQFNKETDVKELQKKADQIPTFEVGKVELTKEHKRAGLTQKHINWINKNQQGMIITPVKRMTNNTADFFMDMSIKAQRPGKRISRTGRIYYETRSNRSDMTKAGL